MAKYKENVYGSCPNTACEGSRCMPIATTDVHGQDGGKIYCPRCKEIYAPRSQALQQTDGSFFGTSFAPFFFLVHNHLVPTSIPKPYVPRIYGFRVNPQVRVFGRAQQKAEQRKQEQQQRALTQGNGGDYGPMPATGSAYH